MLTSVFPKADVNKLMLTSIFWKINVVFVKLNLSLPLLALILIHLSLSHSRSNCHSSLSLAHSSLALSFSLSLSRTLYGDATTLASLSLWSRSRTRTRDLVLVITLALLLTHERLVFYKCFFLCLVLMVMVSEKLGLALGFDDFQFLFDVLVSVYVAKNMCYFLDIQILILRLCAYY